MRKTLQRTKEALAIRFDFSLDFFLNIWAQSWAVVERSRACVTKRLNFSLNFSLNCSTTHIPTQRGGQTAKFFLDFSLNKKSSERSRGLNTEALYMLCPCSVIILSIHTESQMLALRLIFGRGLIFGWILGVYRGRIFWGGLYSDGYWVSLQGTYILGGLYSDGYWVSLQGTYILGAYIRMDIGLVYRGRIFWGAYIRMDIGLVYRGRIFWGAYMRDFAV